jgi:hypothetical protein
MALSFNPAGTGSSRSGKGGLRARLSFSGLLACLISAAAPPVHAMDNPLASFLGLDLRRQVWMPALPPSASPTARDTLPPPRFSAVAEYDYLDLIRKRGGFFYDYGETVSALRLSTAAIPGLDIRFSAERTGRDLVLGDTATSVDQSGGDWGWSGTIQYRFTPWIMPSVTVGGDSRANGNPAQRALGMSGRIPLGAARLDWSADLGERNSDYPLTAHLKDYRPLKLALQMRKGYGQASLAFRRGAWSMRWDGEWTRLAYPHVPPMGYYLADSGATWAYGAKAVYDGAGNGQGMRVTADIRMGFGSHAFRGANHVLSGSREGLPRESSQTRFSYQEAEQRSYSTRVDLESHHGGYDWGAFLGASELEYDALRPEVAFNRHFWDRNGVIDSYQGSLLGVFNTETWLLNGAIYAAQGGGGIWAAKAWRGWRGQGGLAYARLILEANSSLTKRESSFLVAFTEEDFEAVYPTVTADVVTPELRVSRSAGRFVLSIEGAQALPVRVRMDRNGMESGNPGTGDGESYSGGTRGKVSIGLRLP